MRYLSDPDTDLTPPEWANWFRWFVNNHRWRQASSQQMQKWPHQYTVREWANNDHDFVSAVKTIRRFGHPEKFYKYTRTYFTIDNWKYWTMGGSVDETIIINRAEPEQTFGRQTAPPRSETSSEVYDLFAPDYDAYYDRPECQQENDDVLRMVGPLAGQTVLDIGCGTGLLLDLVPEIPVTRYLGLEPSQGMVNEFLRKHDGYSIVAKPFAEYGGKQFDVAVGLFGVGSYLSPEDVLRLPTAGKRWLMMFYKEDYVPRCYTDPPAVKGWHADQMAALDSMDGVTVTPYSNYLIAHYG